METVSEIVEIIIKPSDITLSPLLFSDKQGKVRYIPQPALMLNFAYFVYIICI